MTSLEFLSASPSKTYNLYSNFKDLHFSMPSGWNDKSISIFLQSCRIHFEDLKKTTNDDNTRWRRIALYGSKITKKTKLFTINSCMEVAQCIKSYVVRNQNRMANNDLFKTFYSDIEDLIEYFPSEPNFNRNRSMSENERNVEDLFNPQLIRNESPKNLSNQFQETNFAQGFPKGRKDKTVPETYKVASKSLDGSESREVTSVDRGVLHLEDTTLAMDNKTPGESISLEIKRGVLINKTCLTQELELKKAKLEDTVSDIKQKRGRPHKKKRGPSISNVNQLPGIDQSKTNKKPDNSLVSSVSEIIQASKSVQGADSKVEHRSDSSDVLSTLVPDCRTQSQEKSDRQGLIKVIGYSSKMKSQLAEKPYLIATIIDDMPQFSKDFTSPFQLHNSVGEISASVSDEMSSNVPIKRNVKDVSSTPIIAEVGQTSKSGAMEVASEEIDKPSFQDRTKVSELKVTISCEIQSDGKKLFKSHHSNQQNPLDVAREDGSQKPDEDDDKKPFKKRKPFKEMVDFSWDEVTYRKGDQILTSESFVNKGTCVDNVSIPAESQTSSNSCPESGFGDDKMDNKRYLVETSQLPLKKKRGRPRKNNMTIDMETQSKEILRTNVDEETDFTKQIGVTSSYSTEMEGYPMVNNTSGSVEKDCENLNSTFESSPIKEKLLDDKQQDVDDLKLRVRPSNHNTLLLKNKSMCDDPVFHSASEVVKRKRGRPPKCKIITTDVQKNIACSGSNINSSFELQVSKQSESLLHKPTSVQEENDTLPSSISSTDSSSEAQIKKLDSSEIKMPSIAEKHDVLQCSSSTECSSPESIIRKRGRPPKNIMSIRDERNDVKICSVSVDNSISEAEIQELVSTENKKPTTDEKNDKNIQGFETRGSKQSRSSLNKTTISGGENDVFPSSSLNSDSISEIRITKLDGTQENKTTTLAEKNDVLLSSGLMDNSDLENILGEDHIPSKNMTTAMGEENDAIFNNVPIDSSNSESQIRNQTRLVEITTTTKQKEVIPCSSSNHDSDSEAGIKVQNDRSKREAIETTEENCVVSHSDSVDCSSTLAKMSEQTSSKLDKTTAIGPENDDSIPFGISNNELISEAPITELDNNAEKSILAEKSDVISCNASMDSLSFETQMKKQGSPLLDKTTSRGEENDLLSCYSSNNDSISEEQISKLVSSPENIGDTNDSISEVQFKKCDGSPESHTTTTAEISDLVLCSVSSSEKLLGNKRSSLKSTTTTDKENDVISISVSMDSSSSVTVGNKNKVKHDSSSEAEIQKLDDPREIDKKNYAIPSNISMDSSSCVNQVGKQGTPQTDETTSISEESDVRLCNGSIDCSISISSKLDETNNTSSKDDLIISCPSNITVNTETQMSQWDHNQENKITIVAEKNDVMVCSGSMDSSSSELIKRETPQTNYTSMIVGENNVPCSMGGSSPEVIKKKRGRPPKNKTTVIAVKIDVPCSSSLEFSSPEVVKSKRARPSKDNMPMIGSEDDVPCSSSMDSSSPAVVKRKRGRPPKDNMPMIGSKDVVPCSSSLECSSPDVVKSKRARPSKDNMPMIGSEDDVPCSSSMDSSSPQVVKRKRGRPPKNKTTVIGCKNDVVSCYSIEDSSTSQLINRKRGMLPKTKIPTSDEKIDLTPGSGPTDSSSTEFVKRKRGRPPKNKNVKTSSNEHSESPSYIKEAFNFNDLKISQQSMKFLKSINPTSNGAFLYKSVTQASSVNLAGDSASTNLPSTSRAHVTKTECSIQVANTVVNFNPVVKLVNCMLDPSVSQSIILSRSMQTSKNKNVCITDEQILTVSSSPIKHRNGDMNSISDDSPSTSSNVKINTHFDGHLKSSSRKTRGLSPGSSVKQKKEMKGTAGAKTSTSGPKVSSSSRSSDTNGETINMQTKNNSLLERLTPLEMGSDSIYYLDDIPLDVDKLEDTTQALQLSSSQKKQISNFVTLSFEIQAPNRKGVYKNKPGWVEHYIKDNYKWEAVQFQNMSEELDQFIKREERMLEEMEKFVEDYGK